MKKFYEERKKSREERVDELKERIDFLVSREPNILSFIERVINGLWVVSKETNRDREKIFAMNDLNLMKDRKQITLISDMVNHFSLKELQKNSKRKVNLNCESK